MRTNPLLMVKMKDCETFRWVVEVMMMMDNWYCQMEIAPLVWGSHITKEVLVVLVYFSCALPGTARVVFVIELSQNENLVGLLADWEFYCC